MAVGPMTWRLALSLVAVILQAQVSSETHWSFRALPENGREASIDRLIYSALQPRGLMANARADKRTMIRRTYFDLIGLPPNESEFAATFEDHSAEWMPRLVDRLLASPHFGEKWGRHWLDV